MSEVGYGSAWVLAVVLGVAAVAKLRSPRSTAASFAGLRLRRPAALARIVPLVEIGLAAALIVVPRPAGYAAAVALVGFTVPLVRALERGDAVPCGCFGSAAGSAVSSIDIVRNGVLVGLGILATGATRAVPGFPAIVLVTTGATLGVVALAFARFARHRGSPFRIRLPDLEERA